jgi:flagellar basal-body rod protein FlgB
MAWSVVYTGIMIDPVFQADNYQVARKLLDAAAQLKTSLAGGGSGAQLRNLEPKLAEDVYARTVRPDGNTVEIEHELLAMNRNAVEYEFLTELVSRNIKQLKLAITGRQV